MESELLRLWPAQASTMAPRVDLLYIGLLALTAFFTVVIAGGIVYFSIKYRRRAPDDVGGPGRGGLVLELSWIAIPFVIVVVIFVWSSSVFMAIADAPDDTLDIYVVGKQWMWKFQHPGGQRDINELHVPINRDVRLTMASQDVIHDLFIPAFRVKADVLPGRYTHLWFNATRPGRYRLFCAEYCGTNHSGMIGWVIAMEPDEYQRWLAGGASGDSMAAQGRALFQDLACDSCHRLDAQGRGPMLTNLFGSEVLLQSGETVVADEAYLRQSILNPQAQIVAGFQPIMPTFQGLISEEGVQQLIEYIKALQTQPGIQQPPIPPSEQGREMPPRPPAGPGGTR